jgi:hypothetical protein
MYVCMYIKIPCLLTFDLHIGRLGYLCRYLPTCMYTHVPFSVRTSRQEIKLPYVHFYQQRQRTYVHNQFSHL